MESAQCPATFPMPARSNRVNAGKEPAMRRPIHKAFIVFSVTVLVALSAAAAVLLPDQAADATDLGIVQIDELFGAGTFEP
ncbi:hypothetical protein GT347_06135 [Xylophilus rhododendri]|uniref:Uncharacterized protein n=1 Tax=Xylophilus rhododendri TaxID=2697032 RepID=A0A857J2Y1_9BURK|nr:hypothetical protein [Xylophilus rhododendri]QHI97603.1 hypothetical protein GT347_06135 [Xylophilus rhododendri]